MTELVQLTENEYKDYIRMCCFLGGYKELVQGSGGNISIKSNSEICIKSSGRVLAHTSLNSNHVTCSIEKLESLYRKKDDATITSVIRGDKESVPSMEVFFHLLPSKWVVHLHPTWLLQFLCLEDWKIRLSICNMNYVCIPYKTPGFELSSYIRDSYNNESVLFLQNHGVIICANTSNDILSILDKLYSQLYNIPYYCNYTKMYKFLEHVNKKTESEMILKSCSLITYLNDRCFLPITPDIALFLKKYPLAQETDDQNLEVLFDKYITQLNTVPSIIRTKNHIYILGKSYTQCVCIEEILDSYIDIIKSHNIQMFNVLEETNIYSLQTSEKEKYRLSLI